MTEALLGVARTSGEIASETQCRYRRILDAADGGILTLDALGSTDYVNARGAAILGVDPEQTRGRLLVSFVAAEDIAVAAEMLDQLRRGSQQSGELRLRHKDGAQRWVRFAFAPMVGSDGVSTGAVALFEDVSDSKSLAEEQQSASQELHELYHNAPCGYHSLDPQGVVIQINDTELSWLGYERREVIGTLRFTDLLVAPHREAFRRNFAQLKARGRLLDSEYEMVRKDGTVLPVLLSSTAVKDVNGIFVRSRASVFDISKRRRAENELGESEVRNAAILRAALDCIVSIDSEGKIIEFNPAAERTFGYTREQAIGKDVADLLIPSGLGDVGRRGLGETRARGEETMLGKRMHLTAVRSDGSEFPVEFAMTAVELRAQTIYTAYLRDITKERWAEQELRRYADRLRSISRRLVEVQESERRAIANHLHDVVGQKLTALSINLNIVKSHLSRSLAANIDAKLDDSLALVEETVESIRDVMAELRPALLDDYGLTPVLRWYAEQFTQRTGIAIEVLEQGTPRRLAAAVEEALFRIVQEALANVAKYARAKRVTVHLGATPQRIWLAVGDDGCGFDPANSHQPSKHHGWGLLIMQERAAAVGAELQVQSAVGQGTQVTVTLHGDGP